MKKIAMLLMAHKNYHQINMFINQFPEDKFHFFIHVDKNATYLQKIRIKNNVTVLDDNKTVGVLWGHYTMVTAMLNLLEEAYKNKYLYYWFVSGQDLAIKNTNDIYTYLINNSDDNYIDYFTDAKKYQHRNIGYYPTFLTKRNMISKIVRKLYVTSIKILFSLSTKKYYFGSNWSLLNQKTVELIFNNNDELTRLKKYFSHKLNPDESFFQTFIMNLGLENTIKPYLTYVDWSENKSSPKILTINDFDKLASSDKFLARKFDEKIEQQIINKVISKWGV